MTVIEQIEKLKKEKLELLTVLCGEDIGQYQIAKTYFCGSLILMRQI